MSENLALSPRVDENGNLERVCGYRHCGVTFRTNNVQARYCCEDHRTAERNARYYSKHKKKIIRSVLRRRKKAPKQVEASANPGAENKE